MFIFVMKTQIKVTPIVWYICVEYTNEKKQFNFNVNICVEGQIKEWFNFYVIICVEKHKQKNGSFIQK